MGRIFTFGCSWTRHWWPTWADIIRYSVDVPVYNWGYGGIGNVGIFHRMLECDLKNNFTQDDLILVNWTSWTRNDNFIDSWCGDGNVFTTKKFDIKKWSWENDVIKNATAIISANRLFNIHFQSNMIPTGSYESDPPDLKSFNKKLVKFYLKNMPKDIVNFPNDKNTQFYNKCVDTHPDVINHLYFYDNYIKPSHEIFGNCKKTKDLHDLQEKISNSVNNKMSDTVTQKIIMNISYNFDKEILSREYGF